MQLPQQAPTVFRDAPPISRHCPAAGSFGCSIQATSGATDTSSTTPPPPPPGSPNVGVVLREDFSARQALPAKNCWNLDSSNAPIDPKSRAIIDWISGRTSGNSTAIRRMHSDFGPPLYGIPYVGVSGTQALTTVTWTAYGDESDAGAPGRPAGYPIPNEARTQANYIEGAVPGGGNSGDRHLIIIDRDRWLPFETFATRWNGRWEAGSGATFDLSANGRRTETSSTPPFTA